jgi:hypothetical protein
MERKQIVIAQVHEPRLFKTTTGKELHAYTITGVDHIIYKTCSDTIGKLFVVGKTLDADIETVTKGDYTNHNIKQVYEGGKPVSGSQRKWSGKSKEELESIENQVAVKAVTDLWSAGKLTDTDSEVKYLRLWIREHLQPNNKLTNQPDVATNALQSKTSPSKPPYMKSPPTAIKPDHTTYKPNDRANLLSVDNIMNGIKK